MYTWNQQTEPNIYCPSQHSGQHHPDSDTHQPPNPKGTNILVCLGGEAEQETCLSPFNTVTHAHQTLHSPGVYCCLSRYSATSLLSWLYYVVAKVAATPRQQSTQAKKYS